MSGLFDMINAQSKVFNRHAKVMLRDVVSDGFGRDSALRIFSSLSDSVSIESATSTGKENVIS